MKEYPDIMDVGISYVLWECICLKKNLDNRRNLEQHQGIEERFILGRTFLEEKL